MELRLYRFLRLENIVRIKNTSLLLLLYLNFMRDMYIYNPFQKSLHKKISKFLNGARAFCVTRNASSHASFDSYLKGL